MRLPRDRRLAVVLGVGLLASLRATALPTYDERSAQALGHITVVATADADPKLVALFGELCEIAATVYQRELKLTPPTSPRLYVSPCTHWFGTTTTDRRSRVYVNYLPIERNRFSLCLDYGGDRVGPVYVLCHAVAELFNPHRVPGLEQLLASRYAVPAVLDQLGAKAWPVAYDLDARDGEKRFEAMANDPGLSNHPRWSAAVELQQALDKLKPEVLAKTLAALKGDGKVALAMLRKLLVAQDPTLGTAFEAWDRAVDLPVEKDGSLLLSSFENAAQANLWPQPLGCEVGVSTEWATDGKRCGVLTFAPTSWPRACLYDADWRYGDWSEFGSVEFDVKNPGDQPVHLVVFADDDDNASHGLIDARFTIPPGAEQHCRVSLMDPKLQKADQGIYYEGHVRLESIRSFRFALPDRDLKTPTVLWVDNVRLKP